MKYLTKSWYLASQVIDVSNSLSPDPRAAAFSEELFCECYQAMEEECIRWELELFDRARQIPLNLRSDTSENAANTPGFVLEKSRAFVRKGYLFRLNKLKALLPAGILNKVADIRLLALDRATEEIIREIETFCRETDRACRVAIGAKCREEQALVRAGQLPFREDFYLHDADVLSLTGAGADLILRAKMGSAERTVTFRNATVLRQDADPVGLEWLYEEFYKTDSGYEVHALLIEHGWDQASTAGLADLILTCDDILIHPAERSPIP